jgi:hypothetical protein
MLLRLLIDDQMRIFMREINKASDYHALKRHRLPATQCLKGWMLIELAGTGDCGGKTKPGG